MSSITSITNRSDTVPLMDVECSKGVLEAKVHEIAHASGFDAATAAETIVGPKEPVKPKIKILGTQNNSYRFGLQLNRFSDATRAMGILDGELLTSSFKANAGFKPKATLAVAHKKV